MSTYNIHKLKDYSGQDIVPIAAAEATYMADGSTVEEKLNLGKDVVTGVEFETGETRNGKKVYGKEIDFGVMPNNSDKSVPHGIVNGDKIVDIKVSCNYVSGVFGAVYFPHLASTEQYIELQVTTQYIFINCNKDMSNFTATVTVYYTKK